MSKEGYIHYDFNVEQYDLFHLTVDRPLLNEIMNILASNDHIDVTADREGNIGFNIPSESKIDVRSFNIVKDMVDMIVVIDFKMTGDIDDKEMKLLEHKKASILSAIEIVSDIITSSNIEGDKDVEQEKPTKDN